MPKKETQYRATDAQTLSLDTIGRAMEALSKGEAFPTNLSNEQLVDCLGDINKLQAITKTLSEFLKDRLKPLLKNGGGTLDGITGKRVLRGDRYAMSIGSYSQYRFSEEIAIQKGYLTPQKIEECKREIPTDRTDLKEIANVE